MRLYAEWGQHYPVTPALSNTKLVIMDGKVSQGNVPGGRPRSLMV